ncbi:nuclear transport factor 2 family protein [Allokutzneria oryzae]|uniref:Nuclear transport factor 2 family protein n=1 Tax=Allokutzneria oryzae TaxID=1378989 RepID=A0ABV5ZX62_9PSEU
MITAKRATAAVRTYYELVDAGDVEGVVGLFDDDAVYLRPGYAPLRGHAALRSFYRTDRVIASGHHHLGEFVVAGRTVVVRAHFSGDLKNGSRVSLRFADFFEVSDDARFLRRETFFFTPTV